MIIGSTETVGFKGSKSFEIYIEIQGCIRMGLMVLEVSGEDLEWSRNCNKKVFFRMMHCCFVFGSSIVDFRFEILHMEEHFLGFIGYIFN